MSMLANQIQQGVMPLMSAMHFYILIQKFGEDNTTHVAVVDMPPTLSSAVSHGTPIMLLCTGEIINLHQDGYGIVPFEEPLEYDEHSIIMQAHDVLGAVTCEECRVRLQQSWEFSGIIGDE